MALRAKPIHVFVVLVYGEVFWKTFFFFFFLCLFVLLFTILIQFN